jgi:hypothetical protein
MKELLGVCGLIIFMMACGANQAMMMACITFGYAVILNEGAPTPQRAAGRAAAAAGMKHY